MTFSQLFLFLNAILFSIATYTEIQNQIDHLPKTTQEEIRNILLSSLPSRNQRSTAEQWCCKVDPGVQATSQTRQITLSFVQHGRHKCGYDSCGVFGWSRCTRWCDETWIETQYSVETYILYTNNICAPENITCCEQYIYVLGHCFSFDEIYAHQDILGDLSDLGIVIPGPAIG